MSLINNTDDEGLSIDFNDELSKNLTIHTNVNQEIIITTADKIKIVLIDTKEILTSQRDWWTPFGLTVSFIATLCTADFKETFGMSKDFWHALFVLFTIVSIIWLIKSVIKLIRNWGKNDLNSIIEQIKLKEEKNTKPQQSI